MLNDTMVNDSVLSLLCDPDTHDPLVQRGESLLNPISGRCFTLRDNIPCFVGETTGLNRKYQRMYDRLAPFYDAAENLYFWMMRKEGIRGILRQALHVPAKARMLEVSVGTGANLTRLPQDAELYGLDLSWGMLLRCRRKMRRLSRDVFLCQGEAERLPFRDSSFDVVFHVGGINFFNDRARALREMIRVARPGTRIVIADETEQAVQTVYERTPFVRRFFKSRETVVRAPTELVPPEMQEVRLETAFGDKMYILSFRTPAACHG
jgi:ubiquinone/menaquinone biosynthesis C-methylase UbiE